MQLRHGLLYGFAAYGWWGLSPLYFKALHHVPPAVILAHRIVWSVALLVLLLAARRAWPEVRLLIRRPRLWAVLTATTILISINWLVFIYAVSVGRLVESSLGYFINPLFTVVLGMVFLKERLRPAQWGSVLLAAVGVGYLSLTRGGLPWISLVLPVSFGLYGLIRKRVPVSPLVGLFVETSLVGPFALAYALMAHASDDAHRFTDLGTLAILSLAGVITTLPLLWFVAAAQRLPLVTLGFLQYLTPTLQLAVAVGLFGEPFDRARVVTFGLIWAALALFLWDALSLARSRSRGDQRANTGDPIPSEGGSDAVSDG